MMKKSGFTLAEVLITLGIIGVVAAMTIPTLIANTISAKFRSQFKKTISTLNQAGLMAQAQYDIDYSTPTAGCGDTPTANDPTKDLTICGIFNGTLSGFSLTGTSPYGSATKTLNVASEPAAPLYLTLADGSLVVFDKNAVGCTLPVGKTLGDATVGVAGTLGTNKCLGYIDVNGVTLPNKEVTCTTTSENALGDGTCLVGNDANHMTDIFPIVFHDATVEPASKAARYVLTTSK